MYPRTLIASAVLFALSQSALAQSNTPDGSADENDYIEEITVTAQMREQSIMDVPVTMDVIGSEFLERTNIMELDELSRILPNVQIQEQAVSLPSFNIRGVTDDVSAVSATPRISVYQDGFDISKKTVSSVALFDIARVEVLKGPQPTLFGVAAANGAISIHSNLPTNEKEVKVQLGYNSEQGEEVEFMYNQPINDNHSFRIAGLYREMDGVVENNACSEGAYYAFGSMYNHLGNSEACSGEDLQGVSVQALRATYKASYEKLEVVARAAMEYNDQPGIAFKSGSIAPNNGDTSPYTAAEFSLGSELGIERTLQAYDITVNYDFNQTLSLHADAFYKDVEVSEGFDADGSALRIQDAFFNNDATLKGGSMRLVYDSGDKLAGFIGASINQDDSILPYYVMVDPFIRGTFDAVKAQLEASSNIPLDQNIATNASLAEIEALRAILVSSLFNEDGTPISSPDFPPVLVQGPFTFEAELDIRSYVAELSYFVTDSINVTAGVRYIDETRFTRNTFALPGGPFTFEAEGDFDDTLPRFAISYDANDSWNLYANYAKGRRSPVVDANAGGTNITRAEIVDSYDLGVKYQSANFIFSGAIFTYEYSDYQQSYTDQDTLQSITVTVGDSTMSGIEGMATYNYSDTLTFTASVGFLDAEFADNTSDGSPFQYGGNKFRLAPEVSGAININKLFYVGDWTFDVNWLTSFQSEVFFESSNYPGLSQDTYSLTDVSLKFSENNSAFSYEIYANNLFDKEYLIDAGNTGGGLGIPTFVRGMPRIAGVRLYYEF